MPLPDYYGLLHIPQGASQDEIRAAYKKESLKTHPDRLPPTATAVEKQAATEKFQAVSDAYYVLSDKARRREYDLLYTSRSGPERSSDPHSSSGYFSGMFGAGPSTSSSGGARPDAEHVFTGVFEELLRPEVERVVPFYSILGAISGAGVGFIIANLPGLLFGGFAGRKLGAIRDAKGKSVAEVFTTLEGGQKAEILRALAVKILGTAM